MSNHENNNNKCTDDLMDYEGIKELFENDELESNKIAGEEENDSNEESGSKKQSEIDSSNNDNSLNENLSDTESEQQSEFSDDREV
jgi:hypothetical protein